MIRDNSDLSWEKWGKQNPYFAVLSDEKYRHGNLDENYKAQFFRTGEDHVQRILALAASHFGTQPPRNRALDFGCGVGRLVIPLAKVFDHVSGVDISPAMLGVARQNCLERDVHNVELVLSDDSLTRVKGKFDFIHSCLVLQHIPARRGEVILGQLLARLNTEGVLAIQFPLSLNASVVRRSVKLMRRNFAPLSILVNLVQRKQWNEPLMQMNTYDLNRVLVLFAKHGVRNAFVEVDESGDFWSAYVLGKNSTDEARAA